jgi:membrane associated rhomboid family serine protease
MMPMSDDDSGRKHFPFVNIALIAINVLVFVLYELPMLGNDAVFQNTLMHVTLVPYDFVRNFFTAGAWVNMFRSMFMHASIEHIVGNMLFLYIFGDNVEDAFGHIAYLAFYLICGVAASLFYVMLSLNSQVPTLGASGAIAGVLGAYLVLFPHNTVVALVPTGAAGGQVMQRTTALAMIGMWFVFQFISMVAGLGGVENGGVAFAAHVGGFIAGAAMGFIWKQMFGTRYQPANPSVKPA